VLIQISRLPNLIVSKKRIPLMSIHLRFLLIYTAYTNHSLIYFCSCFVKALWCYITCSSRWSIEEKWKVCRVILVIKRYVSRNWLCSHVQSSVHTSGKYVGLNEAKSTRNAQFQLVTWIFSVLISPWYIYTCCQISSALPCYRHWLYAYLLRMSIGQTV
jgi:hypothetical protein